MDHSQLAEGLSTGSPPATWKEDPPTELSFRAMRLL